MVDNYKKADDVERTYRNIETSDLVKMHIAVGESDLLVLAADDIAMSVKEKLKAVRLELKTYIERVPMFAETLEPFTDMTGMPPIAARMATAATLAGIGPMAAVAGAIAESIGQSISKESIPDLIVENGGDIYLRSTVERTIAVLAGDSPFSGRIGIKIPPTEGIGVCTSAGTVGPSLSFGKADAAVIVAANVALADAVATAAANRIKTTDDLEPTLQFVREICGVEGALLIKADKMALFGVEMCRM